ncbi:hypothetical protein LENED_007531 [Lentinula edodes]|uniref:Uncharacterized protein n=1 Tax=Lentinula edodes TaxID=5353 RepID=A0A1Q3EES1_LENED|nr:hypothetical protein LENED_007531 [Lentinula edodes]
MLRDPDFRAQYPNAHQHVISKALSVLWKNASKEVKEEYGKQACSTGPRASSTSQEPLAALPAPLIPFTSQSYFSTTDISETQQSSASQSNSPSVVQSLSDTQWNGSLDILFASNGDPDFDINPLSDLDPKHLNAPLDDMGAQIELKNALDSQPDIPQTLTSQINFWAWIGSNPLFNGPSSTLDHIAPNTNPFDNSIVDRPQSFSLNVTTGSLDVNAEQSILQTNSSVGSSASTDITSAPSSSATPLSAFQTLEADPNAFDNFNPFDNTIIDQPQNFDLNVMTGDIPEFNAYLGNGSNVNVGPSAFASDANTSAAYNTTVPATFNHEADPSSFNGFNPFDKALIDQPQSRAIDVSMSDLGFDSIQSGLANFDENAVPSTFANSSNVSTSISSYPASGYPSDPLPSTVQANPPSLLNDLGVILQGLDDFALQNLIAQLGQQQLDSSSGDTMNDTDTSDMNFLGYDALQMNNLNAQAALPYNNLVTDCAHTTSSEPSGSGLNSGYTTAQISQSNYTQPPAQYHDANGGAVSSEHQMIYVHPLANQASGSSVYAPFHDYQAQSFAFVEN